MRIIFIRHGKPDYKTDSLLDIGKVQAEAAAERVKSEGISEIYSSTMGRAVQTAEPLSKLLGLEINKCDFMREINWGNENGEELRFGGHPWLTVPDMIINGEDIDSRTWRDEEPFLKNTRIKKSIDRVITGGEKWLSELGFSREGNLYRVTKENTDKTVAMVSHGGASTALISHMLNIPFLRFVHTFRPYFTSVTIIEMVGKAGELCAPGIKLLSDDRHVPRDDDMGLVEN